MIIKSIKRNSILNTIKTLMTLIFPLITAPYALRILQVDNIGKYQYSYSIINFFVLFAGLGISRYAAREGACKRENKEEFSSFASQMFTLNLISTAISYCFLFLLLIFIKNVQPYIVVLLTLSITIIGTTIGLEWVNIACEDYTFITIRTILFQFISMILLFIFIKSENDLLKYVWISVFSNIGANFLNYIHIRKYVYIKIKFSGIKTHIIPILLLFASAIASQIYVNADTIMIGMFGQDRNVGIYSVATRIYSIMQQILASSIIVVLPRLSNYWAKGDEENFNRTIQKCFDYFSTILFPVVIGLFLLAPDVINLFGGEAYVQSVLPLRILSISLLFSIFGIFYTNTMLLPLKKEKSITIIMVISALTNIGLNFLFIPLFNEIGAAITTVISEFIVLVLQIIIVRKYSFIKFKKNFWIGITLGCLFILVVVTTSSLIKNFILKIVGSVVFSVLIYGVVLIFFKNPLAMFVLKFIKSKILNR